MKTKSQDFFYRRFLILILFKLSFLIIIILRIFTLQILNKSKYKKLAINNHKKISYIIPFRGLIYDKNNILLTKQIYYHRLKYLKLTNNTKELFKILVSILKKRNISEEEVNKWLKKIEKNPKSSIILIKNLKRSEIIDLEFYKNTLHGFEVSKIIGRSYISESLYSLIGYISNPNKNQILNLKNYEDVRLLNDLDYRIGQYGIEKYFNSILIGKPGIKEFTVNAFGNFLEEKLIHEAKSGENLKLSIDLKLQEYILSIFKDFSGSIIVSDIKNGNILAIISTPSFDANKLSFSFAYDEIESNENKDKNIFFNKAISLTYPPGSLFKIISSLAILESDIDILKKHKCNLTEKFGKRIFHCWSKVPHGEVSFDEGLLWSCNIYYFKMAQKIDINKLIKIGKEFGFGELTNIEFPNEKKGIIDVKAYKKNLYGENFMPGDNVNTSIGQGFLSVTLLQLNVMITRIATGLKWKPTLLKDKKIKSFEKLNIKEENLERIRNILADSFRSQKGNLHNKYFKKYGYLNIAGKTGTAQVVSKTFKDEDYNKNNNNLKPHSVFCGFAPYDDPKYSISVIAEHGHWGAGIATEIALKTLKFIIDNEDKNSTKN